MITGDETNIELLHKTLFGRSVVSVKMFEHEDDAPRPDRWGDKAQGEVRLDDGTVLYLAGNVGGCSCGAGDYDLIRLNDMPINGITNVEIQTDEDEYGDRTAYRVFVLAQGLGPIELATFKGDDGNGYYGTGFWFTVVGADE